MLVHQAYRFELDPSDRTRSALSSHCGSSRYAFNWGLRLVADRLAATRTLTVLALRQGASTKEATAWARELAGPVPWSLPALRRAWNAAKHEVAPWWRESSKEAYSSGLDGLARALDAWSKGCKGERGGHPGFPTPKKKGHRRSCRFTTGAIGVVDDRHVKLPRIGVVRTKEQTAKLRELFDGGRARILSATVSEGLEHHPGADGELFSPLRTGLDHLALRLSRREDIDEWISHLDTIGVEHDAVFESVEPVPIALVLLRDPDGIPIELFWFGG